MLNSNIEKKGGALSGFYRKTVKSIRSVFNNAIAEILDVSGTGKYYYGVNDRLPNEIIEYINNSGTATACVEKLDQFTQADGFNSPFLAQTKINQKQNWNQLLSDISMNTSYLQAFALRILYRNDMKIGSIECYPYQSFRRDRGGFRYNELMGEYGHITSEDIVMREYEPGMSIGLRKQRINQQIKEYGKQVGEIMYVFKKRNGRLYSKYSVPNYYSGISDIIADGKLSEFELRNISQGWRGNIIISSGPVDNLNKDANDKTEQDYWDEAIGEFVGEDAASVIHLKGKTNEDKPTVTVLNLADLVDATDKASTRIPNRVCRLMTVPPVLVGIATPGQLGNMQELQNSMKLFQMSVLNRQRMIQEAFQMLKVDLPEEYANEDFSISQLNVFEEVAKAVTGDADAGASPASAETLKAQAALRGSVGGVQGVLQIQQGVVAGTTTLDSALSIFKIIFGFTDVEARQLLGQPKDQQGAPAGATVIEPIKNTDPNQDAIDSILRSLSRSDLSKLWGYVNDYKKGRATYEQTAVFLRAFKLTDEQIKIFLSDTDGDGVKDV